MKGHTTIIVALVILVTVSAPIILFMATGGGGLAADRLQRIQELEAHGAQLTEQLAQNDAQRESPRAIYIERIRKGEAQVRDQALEIFALRRRAGATSEAVESPPAPRE